MRIAYRYLCICGLPESAYSPARIPISAARMLVRRMTTA